MERIKEFLQDHAEFMIAGAIGGLLSVVVGMLIK